MSIKVTHEIFIERMKKVKPDYKVLSKYEHSQKKVKFKHKKCGCIFFATPANMSKPSYGGCPACAMKSRIQSKEKYKLGMDGLKEKVKELYPDGLYKLVEGQEYINNKTNYKFICSKCKREFLLSPVNMYSGKGCSYCNKYSRTSKGVQAIERYLKRNHIDYEREFIFPECKNKFVLPFDFKVNIDDKFFLIEFDGELHFRGYYDYKTNHDFGISEELAKTQKRDNIKNKFCKDHNIPLLRIKYTEFRNISKILDEYIEKFNS